MGDAMQENCRKPEKALSARFVDSVTEPGKYFDGQGLFLRVAKNGAKQWVQRITIRGKRSELGLGSPPAVPLAVARKLALENRGKAMLGGDPLAERRAAQEALTFAEAVEAYAAIKLTEFRSEKHRKQWVSSFERLVLPALGNMPVRNIEVSDILRMLEPHWRERTVTAKRLRGRVEAVLNWATVAGHRTGDNPARWAGNLKELLPAPSKVAQAQNQPALALSDVVDWWIGLESRDGMAARALQFLTLTAARSGEVRGMTWDEIDFGAKTATVTNAVATLATSATWTVAASRMKGGRDHRVPLSPEAVAILKSLPHMRDSPYVFFAQRGGKLSDMSISSVMRRMHASELKAGRAGFVDQRNKRAAVPHGLRSTFRQWTAEQGFQRDMAEIALAHFIGSDVERAYQRSDMLERRRAMMSAWAGFLQGHLKNADVMRLA
jgi:integrase